MNVINCSDGAANVLIVATSFGILACVQAEPDVCQVVLFERTMRLFVLEEDLSRRQSVCIADLCYRLRDRETSLAVALSLLQAKSQKMTFQENRLVEQAKQEVRQMNSLVEEIIKIISLRLPRQQLECRDLVKILDNVLIQFRPNHSIIVYGDMHLHQGLCQVSDKAAVEIALFYLIDLAVRHVNPETSVLIWVNFDLNLPLSLSIGIRYEGIPIRGWHCQGTFLPLSPTVVSEPVSAPAALRMVYECLQRENGQLNYSSENGTNKLIIQFPIESDAAHSTVEFGG